MSKTTNHCSFAATVEVADPPRTVYGSTIIIPATLQGPPTRILNLNVMDYIPLEIEY
jgi:hypothetical protein